MKLVIEKILYYHRQNQERIVQAELDKQRRFHHSNLMRTLILTEMTDSLNAITAFMRTNTLTHLYSEDIELIRNIREYMSDGINDQRKGYFQ